MKYCVLTRARVQTAFGILALIIVRSASSRTFLKACNIERRNPTLSSEVLHCTLINIECISPLASDHGSRYLTAAAVWSIQVTLLRVAIFCPSTVLGFEFAMPAALHTSRRVSISLHLTMLMLHASGSTRSHQKQQPYSKEVCQRGRAPHQTHPKQGSHRI